LQAPPCACKLRAIGSALFGANPPYPTTATDATQPDNYKFWRKRDMRRWLIIAAAVSATLATILLMPRGRREIVPFTLTVRVDADPNVDLESIAYLLCWQEKGVPQRLIEDCRFDREMFQSPEKKAGNTHDVSLPSYREYSPFGHMNVYRDPEAVVVQFHLTDNGPETVARKIVRVPAGRGDRSVTVKLP
jgi:hypothetical protein